MASFFLVESETIPGLKPGDFRPLELTRLLANFPTGVERRLRSSSGVLRPFLAGWLVLVVIFLFLLPLTGLEAEDGMD